MGKGTLQHHYNGFFYMHKMAACCQVCCKNLNSCTGEILPVHAMKVDGVLEKV